MPSKKKKYNARFPPARIKKIMQTDEDVGKVAAAVPVIISRALELFIESLILKSNDMTQSRNARTLSTGHIKHIIESEKKFDFLRDLVANMPDVQQTEEDGDSPSGLESVEPPPATRPDTSRRTNASSEKAEAATAEPDKPAKRPRGRPRKQRPQEEQQLPPKKRGRKKKPPKEETTDDSATEDATSNGGSESPDETPSPMARVVDAEQPGDTTKGGLRTEVPFAQYKDTPSDSQTSPLALTVSRPNSDASPVRGTSPYSLRVDHAEGDRSKAEPLGQDAAQDEPRDNLTSSGRPHGYGYGPDSPGTKHVPSAPVVTHPNLPPQIPTAGLPYPIPAHMGLPSTMNNCSCCWLPPWYYYPLQDWRMPPMPSAYSNMMQCPPPPHQMGAPLPPYNLPMPFYGYPPPGALPPHHLPHHPPPHHSPHHLPNHPPHHPKPHPSTEKEDSDS